MNILLFILVFITNTHGCIRSKDAQSVHSSVVRISCPPDLIKTADRRSTITTVSWHRQNFRIESTHPIKALYQTSPIYGASPTASKTFSEGRHEIGYAAVDEAGIIGSCTFSVTITVVRCDRLFNPNPSVGRLECDAGNTYGSMCRLSCYEGYRVVGSQSIECTAEGHWSGDIPFCQTTTCPDPGTPIRGTRFCTTANHAHGSFCTFTCHHGNQLVGKDKIFCASDGGLTKWSSETPTCEPIQPPRIEVCPPDSIFTTSEVTKSIQKPRILFRTASGSEAPYTCSHFGQHNKHNFTLGSHVVTCTAFDPTFGNKATTVCKFTVEVKANPCSALNQPQNGVLLCSRAHGGGSAKHQTLCKLHCDKGYTLARDARGDTFVCDSSGLWKPSNIVSSCVKPSRPSEVKLPVEILYNTSECSNTSDLTNIKQIFEASVQAALRFPKNGVCATIPGLCIVDKVNSHCRDGYDVSYQRKRRHMTSVHRRYLAKTKYSASSALDRRSVRTKRELRYVLPVLFHFGTRVPETTGYWPDEYHNALRRLYGMFDTFESQLIAGLFSITHVVKARVKDFHVEELRNSLAYHNAIAVCDIGHQFKDSIKLCVPCGAGTHFNTSLEQCVLCSAGYYQDQWAASRCDLCPPGTATLQQGATSISQCI